MFLLSLPLFWCSFRAFVFCRFFQLFCIRLSPLFCFFFASLFIFCLPVNYLRQICSAHPLLPLHTCPWSSLVTTKHTWPLPVFCRLDKRPKTCLSRPLSPLFLLFFDPSLPLHPGAPMPVHFYPPASICSIFCLPSQNMMFGEISPAIGPKIYPARPFFTILGLFLCPTMPNVP